MKAISLLHGNSAIHHGANARRMAAGGIGGLIATIVIDLVVIALFPFIGVPADVSFSVIGDTAAGFFRLLGLAVLGGVAMGLLVHYVTGTCLGIIFAWALSSNRMVHVDSIKKGAGIGILYTEFISLPLLAFPPIILAMSVSDAAEWFGISIVMHSLYGAVLGAVVSYGLSAKGSA